MFKLVGFGIFLLFFYPKGSLSVIKGLSKKVVYAINAGGEEIIDSTGVVYKKDPNRDGIASDFGNNLMTIGRVLQDDDQALYRTERYSYETFGYDIPIKDDGNYVLVLKFCEVYFHKPGKKVFDISLNKIPIVEQLDIFAQVGNGNAHDEIVPFSVSEKATQVTIFSQTSKIRNGKIRVEFLKGSLDNPKINAFYVIKGNFEDVPQLLPLDEETKYEDTYDENYDPNWESEIEKESIFSQDGNKKVASGPRIEDPWEDLDSFEKYKPLIIAIAATLTALMFAKKNLPELFSRY